MTGSRYAWWAALALLGVSVGLNWTLFDRVKQVQQQVAQVASISAGLSRLEYELNQVHRRLADIEREAAWIRDLHHTVSYDDVTGRDQPVPVILTWSLRELAEGASVYVIHGPRGEESSWERVEAGFTGPSTLSAEILVDQGPDWALRIVVEEPGRTLTGDAHSIAVHNHFWAQVHVLEMGKRGDVWALELAQRPEPRFAWQALVSVNVTYTVGGETETIVLERTEGPGQRHPTFRGEIPGEAKSVAVTARYVDGYEESGTLWLGAPIPEPLLQGR